MALFFSLVAWCFHQHRRAQFSDADAVNNDDDDVDNDDDGGGGKFDFDGRESFGRILLSRRQRRARAAKSILTRFRSKIINSQSNSNFQLPTTSPEHRFKQAQAHLGFEPSNLLPPELIPTKKFESCRWLAGIFAFLLFFFLKTVNSQLLL